jgi:nanoRNase/pAp phosphatase (c-di-AMP/oligoRNAs hydrolase)
VVYEIFRELNFPITHRTAEALLAGIVYDSAEFRSATTRTIEITAYLLKRTKMTLAQFFDFAEPRAPADKRMAALRSLSRSTAIRLGDFVVATSEANTSEAYAAEKLVQLGADFAFVAQQTHNELRISGRCLTSHVPDYGIDLAKLMDEVGREIGGTGGGHPAAAGVNCPGTGQMKEALSLCVELTKGQLKAAGLKRIEEKLPRS